MKLAAIVLGLVFVFVQAPASSQGFQASIEGVVVKTGTADVTLQFPELQNGKTNVAGGVGEPLSGATVELTAVDVDRVRSYTTRTNRDGRFQFRNVPPGTGYQLVAILSPEYLPGQYGQPATGVPGTAISLEPGEQMKDVRIALTPAGSISGRVLPPGGGGVRSWRVSLVRPFYVQGQRVLGSLPTGKNGVVATTSTDNRGEYMFRGLPAGQYYVMDSLGNFHGGGRTGQPAPILLRPAENVRDADVYINLLSSRTVSGRIVDVNGREVESAQIAIARRDGVTPSVSPNFRRTEGSFMVNAASTGTHVLLVRATERGVPLFGSRVVEIGDADISNIEIPVSPPSDISGVVNGAGGARLRVTLTPLLPGMANAPVIGAAPDFIAVGVGAGEYRVGVTMPPQSDAYIKSIRLGSAEATDGIIRVTGRPSGRLSIDIGSNGGSLSGRVLNENREPLFRARAVLAPDRARRGRLDLFKAVLTDERGNFEMRGIAAGNYVLFVWQFVQEGAWLDPRFLAFYEDVGKAVRIEEGRRASMDATPISAWR